MYRPVAPVRTFCVERGGTGLLALLLFGDTSVYEGQRAAYMLTTEGQIQRRRGMAAQGVDDPLRFVDEVARNHHGVRTDAAIVEAWAITDDALRDGIHIGQMYGAWLRTAGDGKDAHAIDGGLTHDVQVVVFCTFNRTPNVAPCWCNGKHVVYPPLDENLYPAILFCGGKTCNEGQQTVDKRIDALPNVLNVWQVSSTGWPRERR